MQDKEDSENRRHSCVLSRQVKQWNTEEKKQGVMLGWKTLTVPQKVSGKHNLEHWVYRCYRHSLRSRLSG